MTEILTIAIPALVMVAILATYAWMIAWTYGDANRRGMSGALWGLVVFCAPVLGFIIYLAVRSDRRRL